MNLKSFSTLALASAFFLSFAACGSGSDPLSLIDSSQETIAMGLPFSSTGTLSAGYSESNRKLTWTLTFGGTSATVTAPVSGLVTSTLSTSGNMQVTIRANARFNVTVSGLTALGNVRAGDSIVAGDSLGTSTSTVSLALEENGESVCPFPRFTDTALATFNLATASTVCAD